MKGTIQNSQNRLRSPMSDGGGSLSQILIIHISNKPCQCRYTDYWADDTYLLTYIPGTTRSKIYKNVHVY